MWLGDTSHGYCTPPAGTYTQINAGSNHTCEVKTDGTIVCWGEDGSRQVDVPAGAFGDVHPG